jgi:hypothetical protein
VRQLPSQGKGDPDGRGIGWSIGSLVRQGDTPAREHLVIHQAATPLKTREAHLRKGQGRRCRESFLESLLEDHITQP